MSEEKGKLVNLGALWKNEKNGNQFLSGNFGNATIFVFKNKWKKKDTDPDYKIMVGNRTRKPKEGASESAPATETDETF